MKLFIGLILTIFLSQYHSGAQTTAVKDETSFIEQNTTAKEQQFQITKTDYEWLQQLTDLEYYVLRKKGTERPFTGIYNDFKEAGTFVCKGCNTPLYESKHKFDSGSGWPSFDSAIEDNIITDTDYDIGYARTELMCAVCGGHLGHVFNDGPKETTGKRHCINSVSLDFIPKK